MRPRDGPGWRKQSLKTHRVLLERLESGTAPYINSRKRKAAYIEELAPLDWEPPHGTNTAALYARPMATETFATIVAANDQAWKAFEVERTGQQALLDYTNPWKHVGQADLDNPGHRARLGQDLNSYLLAKLLSADTQISLPAGGGWKQLDRGMIQATHGYVRRVRGDNYGLYRLDSIMHARDLQAYRSHIGVTIAESTQGHVTPPREDGLLRSEICIALRLARDRVKLDKTYRFGVHPVIVVSYSMFYVRILQVSVDISKRQLNVRKTPYLHIKGPDDEQMANVQRWYMGSPVNEVNALAPLMEEEEEEGDQATEGQSAAIPPQGLPAAQYSTAID